MSRRFGRQQKRKLLAELAAARSVNQLLQGDNDRARKHIAAQDQALRTQHIAISMARELLGEYCAVLPVRTLDRQHAEPEFILHDKAPIYGYEEGAMALSRELKGFRVYAAQVNYSLDSMSGNGLVRLRIGYDADWRVNFAMSRGAFRNMRPDRAAQHIAEHMAWCLVEDTDFLQGLKR